jgi:hypothetical protein
MRREAANGRGPATHTHIHIHTHIHTQRHTQHTKTHIHPRPHTLLPYSALSIVLHQTQAWSWKTQLLALQKQLPIKIKTPGLHA